MSCFFLSNVEIYPYIDIFNVKILEIKIKLMRAYLYVFVEAVAAVPDGLMAWETLKCGPHNIDLVLTEVELPLISGFALLTLVMEHDICKNIPVISMFL